MEAPTQPLSEEAPWTQPAAPVKQREAYFDNVKGVIVFFVIWWHAHARSDTSGPVLEGHLPPLADCAHGMLIWTLATCMMPCMVFVTGHLWSGVLTPKRVRGLLQITVTCCISILIDVGMAYQAWLPESSAVIVSGALPIFGSLGLKWFLICMVLWRVSLPFWLKLRWPVSISVVLGTLIILSDAPSMIFTYFSFLPFFLAGHLTPRSALEKYRGFPVQVAWVTVVIGVTVGTAVVVSSVVDPDQYEWTARWIRIQGFRVFWCFYLPSGLCYHWWMVPAHLAYYVVAVPMALGFMAMVPTRRVRFLTDAGTGSIYIYLLHIYLLLPWINGGISDSIDGPLWHLAVLGISFPIWCLLGSGIMRPCFKWYVEPQIDCFVKPEVMEEVELS